MAEQAFEVSKLTSTEKRQLLEKLLRERASEKVYPLSSSQQAMWFLHVLAPQNTAYNVSFAARIHSKINAAALRNALEILQARHAVLRTSFCMRSDQPIQNVHAALPLDFASIDSSAWNEQEIAKHVSAEHEKPWDLGKGPLLRTRLFTASPENHILLLSSHHIVLDGWSMWVLLDELGILYKAECSGTHAELPALRASYIDFVQMERRLLSEDQGNRLWSYWQKQLSGPLPVLNLPGDRPRPSVQTYHGADESFELNSEITSQLKEFCTQEGITLFMALLAAFNLFLSHCGNQEEVLVGSPTTGRHRSEFSGTIGDFVNMIALRTRVDRAATVKEFMQQVRHTVLDALANQEYPFPLVVEKLGIARDPSRSPIFQTTFVYHRSQRSALADLFNFNQNETCVNLGGLEMEPFPLAQQAGQFDLTLEIAEGQNHLSGKLKYNTSLFERPTILQMVTQFHHLLKTMLNNPEQSISTIQASEEAESSVPAFIDKLRSLDIKLSVDGDRLSVNAPKGALTEELKSQLLRNKQEIIKLLGASSEPNLLSAPIERVDRSSGLPVSYQQQRLWFLDQFSPDSAMYNIAGALRLEGVLNRHALELSLREIFRRHEVLRTNFLNVEGAPKLVIRPADDWKMRIISFENLPENEKEAEVQSIARREGQKPFDLAADSLFRGTLIALNSHEHVLILAMHHIASDGWSIGVFIKELGILYSAFCNNEPSPLKELPIQYPDYAAWQRRWMESTVLDQQVPFWKRKLSGMLPVLEIPADRPRKGAQTVNGKRIKIRLEKNETDRIRQFSKGEQVTLFMVLLSGFKALLYRYGAGEDIIVGTASANRSRAELNDLIGFFINSLALRTQISGELTGRQLLSRVREGVLDAFSHQDVPFVHLVEALNPERDLNHSPIFQVMFILQNYPFTTLELAGLRLTPIEIDVGTARYDLTMEASEKDGGIDLYLEYNTDIFEETTIQRLGRHYFSLLNAITMAPDRPIAQLPILSQEESELIRERWNETRMEYPLDSCVHELIETQAGKSPQAEAVRFNDNALTYAELMSRSNQLARALRKRGIGPDKLVGICMNRSLDMVVALQGVLKAGGAYVPLDPSYPKDRITFMMQDAGLALLLTHESLIPNLPSDLPPVLCVDCDWPSIATESSEGLERLAGPDNLAYVIYTSGSTGKPKGVQIEHRAVVNFLKSMQREPGLMHEDCLVSVTTLSFDIAGLENYLPLISGARIVIASRETAMDGVQLAELLHRSNATVMQATPATWRLLIDSGWREGKGLKAICGGEALPPKLADELLETGVELWNLYGPTETTIWSTIYRVRGGEDPVPIGRPIANTTIYILDPQGQPVPVNVPGELYIGGDGIARGYLNRPDLTSARFIPDTFTTKPGSRLYKTGDLVRYRANGTIEYLGRMDHQVKVRGYRIELGEIESILTEHESVKQAVVVAREDTPGDQRIIGYIISNDNAAADPAALRTHLSAKLPEYMVPSAFIFMEAYPLTPNGKVDRLALPAPERSAEKNSLYVAPQTATEEAMADLWREVLKTERVGSADNFFDLGGHSLLVVQLQSKIRKRFNRPVTLVELFQNPTVRTMAKLLSGQTGSNGLEAMQ